jgi:hypothetical protein
MVKFLIKKKKILPFLILFFALGSVSWAIACTGIGTYSESGSISASSGGIYGTMSWSDVTFSWNVSWSGSLYTYVYTFSDPYSKQLKELSHLIIQLPDTFSSTDIKPGTTLGWDGPKEYGPDAPGNSNPDIPATIDGIKWNEDDGHMVVTDTGSVMSYSITLVSDNPPMPGNFYAKDGKEGGDPVYAWSGTSSGFGYNIPVPDPPTVPPVGHAPEPLTLILYGFGFAGAGLYRRFRSRPK